MFPAYNLSLSLSLSLLPGCVLQSHSFSIPSCIIIHTVKRNYIIITCECSVTVYDWGEDTHFASICKRHAISEFHTFSNDENRIIHLLIVIITFFQIFLFRESYYRTRQVGCLLSGLLLYMECLNLARI